MKHSKSYLQDNNIMFNNIISRSNYSYHLFMKSRAHDPCMFSINGMPCLRYAGLGISIKLTTLGIN